MKRDENQNVEYKESWYDKSLEWICGYAKAKGGNFSCYRGDARFSYAAKMAAFHAAARRDASPHHAVGVRTIE